MLLTRLKNAADRLAGVGKAKKNAYCRCLRCARQHVVQFLDIPLTQSRIVECECGNICRVVADVQAERNKEGK